MRQCSQNHDKMRKGFTLVELLAVIAIIAVTAVAIGMAGGDTNSAQGLRAAQSTLATMMQTARTIAATKGTHTRLIINVNKDEPGNYLRQIGIVYSSEKGQDSTLIEGDELWAAVGSGIHLPEGTFYIPYDAKNVRAPRIGKILESDDVGPEAVGGGYAQSFKFPVRLQHPMASAPSSSKADWIYYEFMPNGIVSLGSSNKLVVIYAGRLIPTMSGAVDRIEIENDTAIAGFLLTMLAGIVPIPDKEAANSIKE